MRTCPSRSSSERPLTGAIPTLATLVVLPLTKPIFPIPLAIAIYRSTNHLVIFNSLTLVPQERHFRQEEATESDTLFEV